MLWDGSLRNEYRQSNYDIDKNLKSNNFEIT